MLVWFMRNVKSVFLLLLILRWLRLYTALDACWCVLTKLRAPCKFAIIYFHQQSKLKSTLNQEPNLKPNQNAYPRNHTHTHSHPHSPFLSYTHPGTIKMLNMILKNGQGNGTKSRAGGAVAESPRVFVWSDVRALAAIAPAIMELM